MITNREKCTSFKTSGDAEYRRLTLSQCECIIMDPVCDPLVPKESTLSKWLSHYHGPRQCSLSTVLFIFL